MRILAASTAGSGHFNPLVPWLERLTALGHEILVVAPPGLGAVTDRWPVVVGGTPDPDAVAAAWGRVHAASPPETVELVAREVFARLSAGAMVPAMRAAVDDFRPDLVLRDPGEFASALCAAEAAVPQVRIGNVMGGQEVVFLDAARPVLDEWRDGLTDVIRASPLMSRFPAVVEPAVFDDTRRYRLAAAAPRRVEPGFVYATLGTEAPRIEPMRPWFDVLPAALSSLPVHVLFTIGRDLDPATVAVQAPHVTVQAWADHADVLSRAALILHHGGAGTTLDALASGCPQVVVPLFADQGANASAVERSGVGRALFSPVPTPFHVPSGGEAERLRDVVARVLADEDVDRRAAQVAAEMAVLPLLEPALLDAALGE